MYVVNINQFADRIAAQVTGGAQNIGIGKKHCKIGIKYEIKGGTDLIMLHSLFSQLMSLYLYIDYK